MKPWSWIVPKLTARCCEPVTSSSPPQSQLLWTRPRELLSCSTIAGGCPLRFTPLFLFHQCRGRGGGEGTKWMDWVCRTPHNIHLCTAVCSYTQLSSVCNDSPAGTWRAERIRMGRTLTDWPTIHWFSWNLPLNINRLWPGSERIVQTWKIKLQRKSHL